MMGPLMENPSELWLRRDHKHDLAFRPLETALEKGVIDAMYMQSGPCRSCRGDGQVQGHRDLSRYPDWTLQVANIPAAITCTDVMAEKHPSWSSRSWKGMIKVGRWANEHKRAAAAILDKQTFYRDVAATYEGIKPIDLVPNLSPQNLVSVEIGKDFMLSHGYIKNDFDVKAWAAPEFSSRPRRTARAAVEEDHDVEAAGGDRTPVVRAADRVVWEEDSHARGGAPGVGCLARGRAFRENADEKVAGRHHRTRGARGVRLQRGRGTRAGRQRQLRAGHGLHQVQDLQVGRDPGRREARQILDTRSSRPSTRRWRPRDSRKRRATRPTWPSATRWP